MNKYLWLDSETTGLDPSRHVPHQVACLAYVNGQLVDKINLEFQPYPDAEIEEEALAVSGLTVEDVRNRDLTSEDAYHIFRHMLESHVNKYDRTDKFILCGQNVAFDAGFMNAWFNRHKNKFFFGLVHGGAYLDTLLLSLLLEVKKGKRIFVPDRKLATLCSTMGVDLTNAHDALADIEATRELYIKIWKELFK
jgi:DNA polymerase-3 subunit epsilon